MKVVAFDFDGTLVDSFSSLTFCFQKVFEYFNMPFDNDKLRAVLGSNEEGICYNLFGKDLYRQAFAKYLEFYGIYHDEMVPNIDPRIRDLLYYFKDKTHLVLVTGRHLFTTEISFRKFGIENVFEKIYSGDFHGPNKVDSFKQLFKDYNVTGDEVIYIADSSKDVIACNQVGVKVISANYYNPQCHENLLKVNAGNIYTTIDGVVKAAKQIELD